MRKLLAISGEILFAVMLCLLLGTAQAEDATFSEAELDQMMAPIALYPDSLLAQILMACPYPADVLMLSSGQRIIPVRKAMPR